MVYSKKQRLIDSIIRGWAIPPVFLVLKSDGLEEVLDGQQRLTAIRDFFSSNLAIDGNIQPKNQSNEKLDGLRYKDLSDIEKRIINRYVVKIYSVQDHSPEESSELFYRLNQPTSLTSGEQRNALYGTRRDQMKSLVQLMIENGFNSQNIGFSNSRLAYDDVVARVLVYREWKTLRIKISESKITESFRMKHEFDNEIYSSVFNSIEHLSSIINKTPIKLNKASLMSILLASSRGVAMNETIEFIINSTQKNSFSKYICNLIFHDRAASRVTDVSSVVIRDFILHYIMFTGIYDIKTNDEVFLNFEKTIEKSVNSDFDQKKLISDLESVITNSDWGNFL